MSVLRWHFGEDLAPVQGVLRAGGVIAIPTESCYGLAVIATNPQAVATVFALKGRPADKPLPVVASSITNLPAGTRLRPGLETELAALWPAPLTLVLDLEEPLAAALDGPTVAVRVPEHDALRQLLAETGPLTATSANLSSDDPALGPEAVLTVLDSCDRPALLVDAGELGGGLPSTLVRVEQGQPLVLRAGALPAAAIEAVVEAARARSSTAFVENSADG